MRKEKGELREKKRWEIKQVVIQHGFYMNFIYMYWIFYFPNSDDNLPGWIERHGYECKCI